MLKCTEDIWDRTMNVNLKGTFLVNHKFLYLMKERKVSDGSIVNFSSIAAQGSAVAPEYAAAKAGVEAFVRSIAQEAAAFNVRVNAVAPGLVSTPLGLGIPEVNQTKIMDRSAIKRMGTPEEIAQYCLFLANSKSSYITGSVCRIDAGFH